MKIALAQINVTVGALRENADKIISYIKKARKNGARLVIFPELSLTGYPPKDLLLKRAFIEDVKENLNRIIDNTREIGVIVGFVDSLPFDKTGKPDLYNLSMTAHFPGSILYNSAVLADNKEIIGKQAKTHLPSYDIFDEKRYFEPASENLVFEFSGKKIGINICEDIWVERGPTETQAKKGAELIVNISASPFYVGKWRIRKDLIKKRARENRVPVIYVNLVGGQDDLIFDGGSFAYDEKGNLIARAKHFAEDLVIIDLPPSTDNAHGQRTTVTVNGRRLADYEDPPEAEVFNALTLGLSDYVNKNRFKKVILGLSGGVDSALVATLAVKALGKNRVIGVSMPSRFTSAQSIADAKLLAKNLGIKLLTISIDKIYYAYLKNLNKPFQGCKRDVTEENIQARIRGNILMALSNKFGYLVLSTGNKSEMAVGYTTLYGDMAGGLAVISDVPKTMVYKICHYINQQAKKEIISKSILTKAPSAELRPNQKDEDDLPPYSQLDKILYYYIDENKSKEDIIELGFDKKLVYEIIKKIDRNEYKRAQAPLGLKITPKAFGFGRRMPITNWYT